MVSKSLILIGCHGNRNVKFSKKIFENLLLRSHKGEEAETLHKCLCYYPLHKFMFFYCCCACGFVAMATLSFHRFITGKSESRPLFLSDFKSGFDDMFSSCEKKNMWICAYHMWF